MSQSIANRAVRVLAFLVCSSLVDCTTGGEDVGVAQDDTHTDAPENTVASSNDAHGAPQDTVADGRPNRDVNEFYAEKEPDVPAHDDASARNTGPEVRDVGSDDSISVVSDSNDTATSDGSDSTMGRDDLETSSDVGPAGKQGNCPVGVPIVPADSAQAMAPMMEEFCWPELNLDCVTAADCKVLCPLPDFGWCIAASVADGHETIPRMRPPHWSEPDACEVMPGTTTDGSFCFPNTIQCFGCRCIGYDYITDSKGAPCDHPALLWQAPP